MLKYVYFVVFIVVSVHFIESKSEDELISVVALYRHGDRAPLASYKYDVYDESYWPFGFGQLTNIGKRQEYALGRWLRARYDGFLPQRYNAKDIKVYSSNVDRCLMSASANLAALYAPVDDQIWNEALPWQPIPIHTKPEKEDALLAQQKPCVKYNKLYAELMITDENIKTVLNQSDELFKFMSNNSGETINSFWSFVDLYDILYIENLYNLTLPVWAKDILAEENDSLCGFAWAVDAYTTELGRLISGPLIDVIAGHFENITNNVSDTPKFLMLSAHDMTIATLLTTLQIYDYKWPQYSSTVLFELRKGPQNNYVNIFYKNVEEAVNKTLPNCDFNCGLEDFGKLVEPVRINLQQRDEECNVTE